MENKSLTKKLTIKYLQYLVDFADQFISKDDFISEDFDTFIKEYNLFIKRLNDSPGTDLQLKHDLLQICNSRVEDDNPIVDGFLKRMFGFGKNAEQSKCNQLKDELREVRDRLSNLLFQVDKYCFIV